MFTHNKVCLTIYSYEGNSIILSSRVLMDLYLEQDVTYIIHFF